MESDSDRRAGERPSRAWRPLVAGAMRDRVLAVLEAIVGGLDESVAAARSRRDVLHAYLSEETDAALFLSHLEGEGLVFVPPDAADRHLHAAIEFVAEQTVPPGLFGGFTGVAWTMAHLMRLAGDEDTGTTPGDGSGVEGATDPLREIDEVLIAHLDRSPWTDPYDLISGLAGYGVYALERLPHAQGRAMFERVIDRLDELVERTEQGATWHTPPAHLPDWQRELHPAGYYNLGLAHGVPAVIAVLAEAVSAGIAVDRARPLLAGAVDWLLAQRLPAAAETSFPTQTVPGVEPTPRARVAWCYGDAGVAISLLLAARRVGEADWEAAAVSIAHGASERRADAGVVDGFVCHGSAGLGHVFNRIWQATGDDRIAETARTWFDDCLRRFETGGPAGWLDPDNDQPSSGILSGPAGIGLALLAAVSDREPVWDRKILTHVPPRAGTAG